MWTAKEEGENEQVETVDPVMQRLANLREWQRSMFALNQTNTPGFECSVPNCVLRGKLYIGDELGATKIMDYPHITHVVQLAKHPECYKRFPGKVYHSIAVDDAFEAQISKHFDQAVEFIHTAPGAVLVHCQAGVSRSATICMAYLIRYCGMNLDQAYMVIKCVRPIICPNQGFVEQLIAYEGLH
jgi:hypothetical protein